MTAATAPAPDKPLSPFRLFGQRKMAALVFLGFSSGIPLLLTQRTLQAWMTQAGVDLATIGLFSMVALPYSLKFVWAPLLDRYVPPFLGRRRGWLVITQVALLLAIAAMALHDPHGALRMLAVNAIIVAFLSATQDVVGDAYRTDVLSNREMGAGTALWVLGYRLALIVTGSLAFIFADRLSWPGVYVGIAALMVVGIATSFLAPEPVLMGAPPKSLYEAVVHPFQEFFSRSGVFLGFAILVFIVLFRYANSLAVVMATPFLLQIGFTQTEIGVVLGGIGLVATIVGTLLGGMIIGWIGLNRSLWLVAAVEAVTNLSYYGLALVGRDTGLMVTAIVIENLAQGLATAALLGFIMSVCDKRYSATQFALLSSLFAVSRDILVAPAGQIAEAAGWPGYFLFTVLAGIPAMFFLPWIAPWNASAPRGAASHTGETR